MRQQEITAIRRLPGNNAASPGGAVPRRKCGCGQHTTASCGACEKEKTNVQRKRASQVRDRKVPAVVREVLDSPGQALDRQTRSLFEPRFGRDFSNVRVHADTRAAESARAVNARAYTVGRDVVFGAGQYAPESVEGKSLLAHELTHVSQNTGAAAKGPITIGPENDRFEAEADHQSAAIARGEHALAAPSTMNAWAGAARLSRASFTVGPATVNPSGER